MNQKHVFWQAFVIAVLIFASGIFLGYLIEMNRTSKIISVYQELELDILNIKIHDNLFSINTFNCSRFFDELVNFADKSYKESQILDKYESAGKLSEGIKLQHKKYDLLRAILWVDAIKLKEKCYNNTKNKGGFSTLVYFYEYETKSLDLKSKQAAFSRKLTQIKEEFGNKIILIPIAGNMDISSIDYLKGIYNVTNYPTVLLNEKIKAENTNELDLIENYINK